MSETKKVVKHLAKIAFFSFMTG